MLTMSDMEAKTQKWLEDKWTLVKSQPFLNKKFPAVFLKQVKLAWKSSCEQVSFSVKMDEYSTYLRDSSSKFRIDYEKKYGKTAPLLGGNDDPLAHGLFVGTIDENVLHDKVMELKAFMADNNR
ncbi:MAG: hypothetical protein P4L79_10690 [Legionella sp.]|uniref:hypothetical protein n=1 Tax=Legionella sp. TaxID=459 RepID=UPI00284A60E6|nr:hypothetical protein [Legionella sp.]